MKCSECQKKMSDHLDQTLSLHEQRLMRRHLEECAQCREAMESLQLTRALLQGIQEEPLPAAFDRRMKHALFQQNLKQTIGPNVVKASASLRQTSKGISWSGRNQRKRRLRAISSLVALATVGIGILVLSNDMLVPVTTPEPDQVMMKTTIDQDTSSGPMMMRLSEPETSTPAQTGNPPTAPALAPTPAQTRSMESAQDAGTITPPASTSGLTGKPKAQYIDYAYQIEQKLIGYQYQIIDFDETTGIATLLITTDQSGTLINRELEILCQGGRIQIDDNWPGL